MIRLLFVDDEADVRAAMRRTLREMRDEWHMEFCSSGPEALEELKNAPVNVIVSDMRMPGMDGWELLAEVRKLYPQTVRLVLSGHAEARSIMRAVGAAHQYLAKPCEAGALKAAIAQTLLLRHLLASEELLKLAGGIDTLPSAPKAFQEILACLQRPNASVADAAKIISRDVAMTANVVKLVNSAFFGSRQTVTSADRAVAYLGLDTLGALVLGHGIFKSGAATGTTGVSLEGLWQHSLEVAGTARTVALRERFSQERADEAFLGGMLHDVGKVVFATQRGGPADPTSRSAEEASAQMQAHHATVGAYLLGLWGFPNSMVEAVAFHDAPSQASGEGLSMPVLIHIADRLVHQRRAMGAGVPAQQLEPALLEERGLVDRWPVWLAELDALDRREAAK